MLAIFFHEVSTLRATGEPHGDGCTAFAFDVMLDDGRAEQAAAGAGIVFQHVVENAGGGRGHGDVAVMRIALFPKGLMVGLAHFLGGQRIGHLDHNLPSAMRAEALFAGVLIFDFEGVPIGAHDVDAHA